LNHDFEVSDEKNYKLTSNALMQQRLTAGIDQNGQSFSGIYTRFKHRHIIELPLTL